MKLRRHDVVFGANQQRRPASDNVTFTDKVKCQQSICSRVLSTIVLLKWHVLLNHLLTPSTIAATEGPARPVILLVPNSTTRTPATNSGYGHHQRTPPTDELTTILQLVVQQIHHQRTKICHIPTSWHVEMLGSGIALRQICRTTSCRIVASSSVGGVAQHIRSRCPCSGVWR